MTDDPQADTLGGQIADMRARIAELPWLYRWVLGRRLDRFVKRENKRRKQILKERGIIPYNTDP